MQLLLKVSESVLVCQIKQNRIIALVFWNACDGEMANLYIKVYTRWLNHVELQANGNRLMPYPDFEIDFKWPAWKCRKAIIKKVLSKSSENFERKLDYSEIITVMKLAVRKKVYSS